MKFLKELRSSFAHAWRGCLVAFQTERSFRIQCAAALVVLGAAGLFPLATWERVVVVLCVGAVLVLELLNSACERFLDLMKPRLDSYVRDMKDIFAGAVLVTVVISTIVAILVFGPHVWGVLSNL